jgi:hypothetical protein
MVLFTFYRNLVSCLAPLARYVTSTDLSVLQFARLRSPQQFATVQLLSSIAIITIFPLQTTRIWHRGLELFSGYNKTYEEHVDNLAVGFYVRGVAQNVTALSFLGK